MGAIVEHNVPLVRIACNSCKHLHRDAEGAVCDAFAIIPDEILEGNNAHTKPLQVQENDIVFQPENPDEYDRIVSEIEIQGKWAIQVEKSLNKR